ncbi:MAG: hypothetical protein NT178_17205 [Proteobacteria bacterium]|nr:hypothetical protein [Pseudomonadota bacterium]
MRENESANKKSDKVIKAIRAASAIIVFGIPLITGTALMIGYGAYNIYKKIKR